MAALTAEETALLGQILQQRYQQLIEEIRDELASSGEQHYVDLAGRVTDLGDDSVADMLSDMNAAMIDRQVIEIREIEAAQKRIAAGDFGTCSECTADIPFERLRAYPTAMRCVACQSVHERTFAHEGTPTL